MVHFWTAHHTQIYRELVKMEEEEQFGKRYMQNWVEWYALGHTCNTNHEQRGEMT